MAAAIDHPNVIPVYEAGESDGHLFIAMRFVEGEDLSGLVARFGRLPVPLALGVLGQIAGALDAAHRRGLVHRDVKPANVLLVIDPDEPEAAPHAYLTDFGITREMGEAGGLTATGAFMGSVSYAAPEQVELGESGPATVS